MQKHLPKWLKLHTDTVWQPNYMLMLHTRYILAGIPWLEKWLCKSTFLPDVYKVFLCPISLGHLTLTTTLTLLVYARLDAGDPREPKRRDRCAPKHGWFLTQGLAKAPTTSLSYSLFFPAIAMKLLTKWCFLNLINMILKVIKCCCHYWLQQIQSDPQNLWSWSTYTVVDVMLNLEQFHVLI